MYVKHLVTLMLNLIVWNNAEYCLKQYNILFETIMNSIWHLTVYCLKLYWILCEILLYIVWNYTNYLSETNQY